MSKYNKNIAILFILYITSRCRRLHSCFSRQPNVIVKSVLSGCLHRARNTHAKFQVHRSGSFRDIVMSQSMVNRLYYTYRLLIYHLCIVSHCSSKKYIRNYSHMCSQVLDEVMNISSGNKIHVLVRLDSFF